jgi:hypothetical protein
MRALRVVGLTEDGEVVLEDPVRLERYTVRADERLRAAARGDLSRLGQIAIELESQLRPREIQARIRAGASVEQVATAAGVPEQKIERFAYPVLLERFRTADNAQRAHPVRADGPDSRTLAEVVAHTFGLRGQTYEGTRWDSWKGEDGRWVVALSWRAGRSDNRAHWTFQPGAHGGTVTALDEHASDLVEGLPARPLRTVGAVVDMTRPEGEPPPAPAPVEQWRAAASDSYRDRMPHGPDAGRPAPERSAARTAPEPWRAAPPAQRQAEATVESAETQDPSREQRAPAAEWTPGDRGAGAERIPAARPAPAEAEATSAASPVPPARTATTGTSGPDIEAPVVDAPASAEPATPAAPDVGAAQRPEPAPEAETSGTSEISGASEASEAEAPEPGPAVDEPAPPATRRTKKGKPVMPSWDEVLLGVRGPR